MLTALRHDLRHAIRLLSRAPAFTLPAVASLALGIAVNTTMFSVVSAALLRPLGGPGRSDLVRIGASARGQKQFRSASPDELRYLREHAASFAEVAGEQMEGLAFDAPDGSQVVAAEIVTANYFAMLELPPRLGEGFAADESRQVVVISDRFWRRQFGADPAIVGRSASLNSRTFTIAGVAPPGFGGTFPGVDIDLWLPAAAAEIVKPGTARRSEPSMQLVGRLKLGISLATAGAELDVLSRRMAGDMSGRDRNRTFVVARARGVHPAFARPLSVFLLLLMGVVAVVLLIACANVASLQLARANARRTELAVRLACGASRGRIVGQLLAESAVLAVGGGALGLLLSLWPVRFLNAYSLAPGPTGAPVFLDLQLDVRVLLFTTAVSLISTLAFGLLPALQATRLDLVSSLKGSSSPFGRPRSRFRSALMIMQVALSCVLLIAAVLLFRSLRNSGTLDAGFDPDHVVVAALDLRTLGYQRPRIEAFYAELLRRARTLPGVERAALADFIPMGDPGGTLTVPGMAPPAGQERLTVPFGLVSDEYFSTVRQPLLRGRDFTAADRAGAPLVAIVNEAMAARFWPGADPVGQRIRLAAEEEFELDIVGIAKNARYASFGGDIGPLVILPALQHPGPPLVLHVRTSTPASDALADIRRLVRDIDRSVPYSGQTMREGMATSLVPARIAQLVFGASGVVAIVLATGGLYGLVCYTLAQRVKEIGIRVALGATRRNVFRVIVGGAIRLTVVGVALGTAIAAGAMRFMSALLYGLSPTDPLTFGGIAMLLVLVTLAAGYAAARRGLDVDPMVVLRNE